jgi:hypothetical protein
LFLPGQRAGIIGPLDSGFSCQRTLMIPLPAKALQIRREAAWPGAPAALALVIALAVASLTPAARSEDPGPGNFWTLTVTDEQGQPVPGAVLLQARSYGSGQHHGAGRPTMSPLIIDQRNKRFEPFVSVTAPRRRSVFPTATTYAITSTLSPRATPSSASCTVPTTLRP